MKRYVIVGLGIRSQVFVKALAEKYKDHSHLAALYDHNPGRLKRTAGMVAENLPDIKTYDKQQFDKMIEEIKPDFVIVTTPDFTHNEYICRAMEAGCDVITEKPMTIDETRCQQIIETVKRTGRSVRVTFNYRYSPPREQVKELLMEGIIGKVLSVEFQWLLDTYHGADYFRRWHRNKSNSGGLLVHKATHHFDLINWWLRSEPETVFARGLCSFYNSRQAQRHQLEQHGTRCLDCKLADKCNYFLDMKNIPTIKELYLDNEKYDGYIRDKCVFRDDIDIEDTISVIVQYRNGAILTYSLNAFMPWEGYRLEINGTKGRLEQHCQETTYVSGDGTIQGALIAEGTSLKMFPHFKTPYEIPVSQADGAHGGGDIRLLEDIFGAPEYDPLERNADYVQGIRSALVGIAANNSIKTGKLVRVDDLVSGLPVCESDDIFENELIPYVACSKLMFEGKEVVANIPQKVYEEDLNED